MPLVPEAVFTCASARSMTLLRLAGVEGIMCARFPALPASRAG
jgi:hypothetical protein